MMRLLRWLFDVKSDQTWDVGHWRCHGHHPLWSRSFAGSCRLCVYHADVDPAKADREWNERIRSDAVTLARVNRWGRRRS